MIVFSCNAAWGEKIDFRHEIIAEIYCDVRIDKLENLSEYSCTIPPWNDHQGVLPFIMPEDWNLTDSRLYKCAKCGNTYRSTTGSRTTSCCVIHPPGSCCHYMEELVIPESELQTVTEDTK
jgi:hypothetical protein